MTDDPRPAVVPEAAPAAEPGDPAEGAVWAHLTGTVIAKAIAAEIGAPLGNMLAQIANALPQMLAQAVAAAAPKHPCAHCLTARMAWNAAHDAEIRRALTLASAAAGLIPPGGEADPADPRAAQLDLTPYFPDHMRTGSGTPHAMPALREAVTIAGGDEVCPAHLPGVQQGRRPLLIASAGLNLAALANGHG